MNLYGYGWGNPVGVTDPFGLQVGQFGDGYIGNDPVQFGSGGGGRLGRMNESSLSLPQVTGAAMRMFKLCDIWPGPVYPSGVPMHRMTREEYEDAQMWAWLDTLQSVFDIAGEIPVVGIFFDGANALIYLSRGDILNASISGAAIIIPGAAGMRMVFRNADEAAAALRRLTNATEEGAVSLRRTGNGNDISLPILNQPPYCFVAGTLVATSAGLTAIECIQPSDEVWAFNSATGKWELCEVEGISSRVFEGEFVTVELSNDDGSYEQVMCTGNHPFWVESGESLDERPAVQELPANEAALRPTGRWTDAKWLRLDDRFLTRTGKTATVVGLTIRMERVPVYNLKVSRLHNYTVGQVGVAVHNNNVCPGPNRTLQDAHVVPQGMMAHEKGEIAQRLRKQLDDNGIDIDDDINRFLTDDPTHNETHRTRFLRWLEDQLDGRTGDNLRRKLEQIRDRLKKGPIEIPSEFH